MSLSSSTAPRPASKCPSWQDGGVSFDPLVLDLLSQLPSYDGSAVFPLTARLREEGWASEVISAALTQSRLRAQAKGKFGSRAERMLFTADALEQASRPDAAAHHASVFADAGISSLREVGCGIGADTLAFAQAGIGVTARELDPERADFAAYNLRDYDGAVVEQADGLADITEDALWADPARRDPHGRIINPEKWQPPLSVVLEAARRVRVAGIKIAPGIDYSHLPQDAMVEWLSSRGELVESIIWLGRGTPGRRAVLLGGASLTVPGNPSKPAEMVEPAPLGNVIYEPDPAIIRAGGIATLCATLDLAPVAPGIAYLTGGPARSPFLTGFSVTDVLPLQEKKLSRELRSRDIGTLEIKKRGVNIAPDALRSRLKLKGSRSATLILTPLLDGRKAVLVERLPPDSEP